MPFVCVCMCCILLIHSSANGYLIYFHLLTIVNNTAKSMGVQNLFETWLSVLWGICTEVELLDHMVVILLIFEEPPYCFSQWLYHFTFLQTISKSLIFHIFANTCFFFYSFYPNECEVVTHCFNLQFPNDS